MQAVSPYLEIQTKAADPSKPTAVKASVPLRPRTLIEGLPRPSTAAHRPDPAATPTGPPCKRASAALENTNAKLARLTAPTPSQAPEPKAAGPSRDTARQLSVEFDAVSKAGDGESVFPTEMDVESHGLQEQLFAPTPYYTSSTPVVDSEARIDR